MGGGPTGRRQHATCVAHHPPVKKLRKVPDISEPRVGLPSYDRFKIRASAAGPVFPEPTGSGRSEPAGSDRTTPPPPYRRFDSPEVAGRYVRSKPVGRFDGAAAAVAVDLQMIPED